MSINRLAFYGLATNLVIYLQSVMGMSASAAAVQCMLFEGSCYLSPILGALLADSKWGRYKTILIFSGAPSGPPTLGGRPAACGAHGLRGAHACACSGGLAHAGTLPTSCQCCVNLWRLSSADARGGTVQRLTLPAMPQRLKRLCWQASTCWAWSAWLPQPASPA